MNEFDILKTHHQEFLSMIDQIRHLLDAEDIEPVADGVMALISRLNGQLMVHLSMEDRHIYPALMASEDFQVLKLAHQFKGEIGPLFRAFQDYRLKWSCASQVSDDPRGFLADTETIFAVINKRMTLEDDALYPEVMALQLN